MTAMESKARAIFRDALLLHYIDGIAAGDKVESWLRKHGGWFPDRQENYADEEAPLVDEGADVSSPDPTGAIDEAVVLMKCLVETLNDESAGQLSLADVRDWLERAKPRVSRDRNRSRSPRASREYVAHLERLLDCKNAELNAKKEEVSFLKQRLNVELETQLQYRNQERDAAQHQITLKEIQIAGLQAKCDGKDGLIAILNDQIAFLAASSQKTR